MNNNFPIRVGVVGVGRHFVNDLFPILVSSPLKSQIIFTAFCDSAEIARDWVRRRFNGGAYITDDVHDSRFWQKTDCVICAATPEVHRYVLSKSVADLKHCFCEKPVAETATSLHGLNFHRAEKVVIRVGDVFRYTDAGQEFRDLLRNKEIRCLCFSYRASNPRGKRWDLPSRKAFALTHLVHAVDFVSFTAGPVTKVESVEWGTSRDSPIQTVDAILRTDRCPQIGITATNGADHSFIFTAEALAGKGQRFNMPGLEREKSLRYGNELAAFFGEIRGESQCHIPDLKEATANLQVVEEIERRK